MEWRIIGKSTNRKCKKRGKEDERKLCCNVRGRIKRTL